MTILVIEDDSAIREMLVQTLEEEGFAAVGTGDGMEALSYLQTTSGLPCVILLDLMMPGMNGWQFRQIQQDHPAIGAIPVVLLSARPDVRASLAEIGVDAYVPKPINFDLLMNIIRRYCGDAG
jgi:two-component system, OmpR family, response regulator CpxR